jgi:tetratricopeptide (TPR) repeat protein
VKPLSPDDRTHLQAAEGWLDLGNHVEANAELEKIAPANRAHPDVLQVRWGVFAKAGKWDACLDIATALTQMTPRRRFGWIHRAISLDQLQRPAEAKELLFSAVGKLGPSSTVAFHLACVCARLGQLVEAKRWVKEAIELAQDKATLDRLRLRLLDEPALESFWRQIGDLGDER